MHALRANRRLDCPINLKGVEGKRARSMGLPTGIWSGWTDHAYAEIGLTIGQEVAGRITAIDQMFIRQQILLLQIRMDVRQHVIVAGGGRGGFDMDNQVRAIVVSGFGEMRLIADPTYLVFDLKAGLRIVRGRLPLRGIEQFFVVQPTRQRTAQVILLPPDIA